MDVNWFAIQRDIRLHEEVDRRVSVIGRVERQHGPAEDRQRERRQRLADRLRHPEGALSRVDDR